MRIASKLGNQTLQYSVGTAAAAMGHKRSQEELPHARGKEQRLHFAGAAMRRYPTPKVRESQVR